MVILVFHVVFFFKDMDHGENPESFGDMVVDLGDGGPVLLLGSQGGLLEMPGHDQDQGHDDSDNEAQANAAGKDDEEQADQLEEVGDHPDYPLAIKTVDDVGVVDKD